jgi:hypothetical protein
MTREEFNSIMARCDALNPFFNSGDQARNDIWYKLLPPAMTLATAERIVDNHHMNSTKEIQIKDFIDVYKAIKRKDRAVKETQKRLDKLDAYPREISEANRERLAMLKIGKRVEHVEMLNTEGVCTCGCSVEMLRYNSENQ